MNPNTHTKKGELKSKLIELVGNENIQPLIDKYKNSNAHYTITETAYSVKIKDIENKLTYLITPDFIAKKNWGILSSIKSELKKSGKLFSLPYVHPKEIEYFRFSRKLQANDRPGEKFIHFDNVIEMDITAAYVNAARILGIISNENFQKLIKGKKQNRLKVLGALASQKTVEYFVGSELINTEFQSDPHFRNVWFNIVSYTDNVINSIYLKLKDKALFYYVDNLYLYRDEKLINEILAHFKHFGFEMKHVPLEKFAVYNARAGRCVIVKRANEKKFKTFFIPVKKQITYELC